MADFTKWNIWAQIKKLAIPVSIWMFFNTMYNVVDSYFAWKISDDALAAVWISFPIFFLIIAFGAWMWSWVSVLISNAIWEKNNQKIKQYIWETISFWLIISLFLTIVWYFSSPYLLQLLWAEWNLYELSLIYTRIIFLASVFFITIFFANSILQSHWDTKTYWKLLVISFFINIFLDPFLINWFWIIEWFWFGFAWIAIATLITNLIWTIYIWSKVYKLWYFENFKLKNLKPDFSIYKEILKQWIPASWNMLTIWIWIFVITYFITLYWNEAIAAYWVVTRIEQIVLMPIMWITTAVLIMVWQNNWAKNYDRIGLILKTAFKYWLSILIILIIPVFYFAWDLIWIFTKSQEVIKIWTLAVHIWLLTSWSYLLLFTCTSALQWLKKPNFALWIWLFRQILIPGMLFYLITSVFFLEINAIWWWIFCINTGSAIFAYFYTNNIINKLIESKLKFDKNK